MVISLVSQEYLITQEMLPCCGEVGYKFKYCIFIKTIFKGMSIIQAQKKMGRINIQMSTVITVLAEEKWMILIFICVLLYIFQIFYDAFHFAFIFRKINKKHYF